MIDGTDSFALGLPRFRDPRLARCAREQGILAAWRAALARGAHGASSLAEGDFAVALRDETGRVFLAVDRFGMQTLCYRVDDGQIRFAERADALVDAGSDVDAQAIYDYLYFHAIPSPRTIFKDVYRLPPGHCAWFENGRLSVTPYWTPEFREQRAAVVRGAEGRVPCAAAPARWSASWTAASRHAF